MAQEIMQHIIDFEWAHCAHCLLDWMAPEPAPLPDAEPVVVHILWVSRTTAKYREAFGPMVANATLRGIREALSNEGVEAPNGTIGPKLFARPEVARRALQQLAVESVRLRDRSYFLEDLRYWHLIVEEGFVPDVEQVLKQIPGTDRVHTKAYATIEIEVVHGAY